ncbi:hypothetical protein ACLKA6_016902 [Drosophila palustris]
MKSIIRQPPLKIASGAMFPPARDGIEVHGAARVRILLFTGHHGQLHTIWLTTHAHDAARARHFLVTGHRGHRHVSAGQAEPENTKIKEADETADFLEVPCQMSLPIPAVEPDELIGEISRLKASRLRLH